MKLDFFQCEIGFLSIKNWITFNLKLDFYYCEIRFLPKPCSMVQTHGINLSVRPWAKAKQGSAEARSKHA